MKLGFSKFVKYYLCKILTTTLCQDILYVSIFIMEKMY